MTKTANRTSPSTKQVTKQRASPKVDIRVYEQMESEYKDMLNDHAHFRHDIRKLRAEIKDLKDEMSEAEYPLNELESAGSALLLMSESHATDYNTRCALSAIYKLVSSECDNLRNTLFNTEEVA